MKNAKALLRIIIILVVAVLTLFFIFRLLGQKDFTNRTAVGRKLVPWSERAETHLREHLFQGQSGQNIANSIQRIAHPTGAAPRLSRFDVRRMGQQISVVIEVVWKGGFSSKDYTTRVVWEFDQKNHIRAVVREDEAPFAASSDGLKKLDDYFRTECYAVLRANLGD